MYLSAEQRRSQLKLFNISEIARMLGIDDQEFRRRMRKGEVPTPTRRLGNRLYFHDSDVPQLAKILNKKSRQ